MISPYNQHARRCSPGQVHQLSRLTCELGLLTIRERNAWIEKQVGHEVHHLVDLSAAEAQACVDVAKVEIASRGKEAGK